MRYGGEKRGSTRNRRRRKEWMLAAFGDGQTCQCVHCGVLLTYETVTADRIVPGGTYRRENVQPACFACNRARSDNESWAPVVSHEVESNVACGV